MYVHIVRTVGGSITATAYLGRLMMIRIKVLGFKYIYR